MSRAHLPFPPFAMVATGKTVNSLAAGARRVSKRLVASYVLDWILIAYLIPPLLFCLQELTSAVP